MSRNILVVEDDAPVARVVSRLLQRLGHATVVVDKGADALSALVDPAASFDLVLLDAQLPDMSGESVLRALRERGDEVAVVVASGDGEAAIRDAGLRDTLAGFLPKPFGLAELRACLERLPG